MGLSITTERLHLREWHESDADAYAPTCADPEVMRYIGDGRPAAAETAQSIERMRAGSTSVGSGFRPQPYATPGGSRVSSAWVPTFLPEIMPAVEIGWRLGRGLWRQGLATEGARAALADGFARCAPDEIVSISQPRTSLRGG
jgi:RimJ/RimL family protein N-acetyltransferase